MMRNLKILFACFITIMLSIITISCENDSESDLIEIVDPVQLVTYENTTKAIIDTNCILCHNDPPINFAPMPLLTFTQVTEAIENRGLINRISTEDINAVMPPGGPRLPQSTIDLIIQWNNEGLPEQ